MTVPLRVFLLRKKKQRLTIKKHRIRDRKYKKILASRMRRIAVLRQVKNPNHRFILMKGDSKLVLREQKKSHSKNRVLRRRRLSFLPHASYFRVRRKRKYTLKLATKIARYIIKRGAVDKWKSVMRKITRSGYIIRRKRGFKRKFAARKIIREWALASRTKDNRLVFISRKTEEKWTLIPKRTPEREEQNLKREKARKVKLMPKGMKQQKMAWKYCKAMLKWSGTTNAEKMQHWLYLERQFKQKNKIQNAT